MVLSCGHNARLPMPSGRRVASILRRIPRGPFVPSPGAKGNPGKSLLMGSPNVPILFTPPAGLSVSTAQFLKVLSFHHGNGAHRPTVCRSPRRAADCVGCGSGCARLSAWNFQSFGLPFLRPAPLPTAVPSAHNSSRFPFVFVSCFACAFAVVTTIAACSDSSAAVGTCSTYITASLEFDFYGPPRGGASIGYLQIAEITPTLAGAAVWFAEALGQNCAVAVKITSRSIGFYACQT